MRIALVGGGLTGFTLLENLKDINGIKIYLIESQSKPFKKHLLVDWLVNKVSDSDFFFSLENFKENLPSLEVIEDRVIKVNFEKKKLFFKDSDPLDFDKLILCCGLKARRITFSGVYKEGVYYLGEKPLPLKEDLALYEHVIVYAQTLLGLFLFRNLLSLKKDVKIVIPPSCFFSPEVIKDLKLSLEEESSLYLNNQIEEAVGEGRIRAIKISGGKFLACDTLIIDSGYSPNFSLLKDYPQLWEGGVLKVDEYLRIVPPDCFAGGDLINPYTVNQIFKNNNSLAIEEARVIASNIQEPKSKFTFPVLEQTS